MLKKTAVLLFFLFASHSLSAEDQSIVLGGGSHSCGKWLEAKNNVAMRYQYQQWLFGFISGSNYRTGRSQSTPIDGESVVAFVDQYCTNNPLHVLVWAAAAVVQETGGPKTEHKWKR